MHLPCPIVIRSSPFTSDSPYPYQVDSTSEQYLPNNVVFHWAPDATCHSTYGIGRPPPNTTERPKLVRWKPFIARLLSDKMAIVHPATWQNDHCSPYPPKLTFAHKAKNPQIIVFIVFSIVNLHAHTYECRCCQPTSNCTLKTPQSTLFTFQPTQSPFDRSQLQTALFRASFP